MYDTLAFVHYVDRLAIDCGRLQLGPGHVSGHFGYHSSHRRWLINWLISPNSSRSEGASRTFPEGASRTFSEGASRTFSEGASRTFSERATPRDGQ